MALLPSMLHLHPLIVSKCSHCCAVLHRRRQRNGPAPFNAAPASTYSIQMQSLLCRVVQEAAEERTKAQLQECRGAMQRLSAQVTEAESMASPTPAQPGEAGSHCCADTLVGHPILAIRHQLLLLTVVLLRSKGSQPGQKCSSVGLSSSTQHVLGRSQQ